MARAPLPTTLTARCTPRPGQNMTSLGPGSGRVVLLPVIPTISESQSRILVKRTDVCGESGKNFILQHVLLQALHPSDRPNRENQIQLVSHDAGKRRKINYQNGRERPHFSGFNPPKKSSRSLPPVSEVRYARRRTEVISASKCITSVQQFSHGDLNESCITACMAGPQGGETPQWQS
jgi:hypothetical protein